MTEKSRLILWDIALLIGIAAFVFGRVPEHQNLIIGLVTVLIFSNCVRNHITTYKLSGKIY